MSEQTLEVGCRFHGTEALYEEGKTTYVSRLMPILVGEWTYAVSPDAIVYEGSTQHGDGGYTAEKIVCQALIRHGNAPMGTCGLTVMRWEDERGWVRTEHAATVEVPS